MKNLTSLFVSFLFTISIFAQATKWDLNGNNSGSNDFIGTTNSQALVFKTDNAVRLKISNDGNVTVKDLESNVGGGVVKVNGNGKLGRVDYPNDPAYYFDGNGNFSLLSNIVSWSTNTNLVTLDASKKVGIGIPNPVLKFEVLGDAKIHGMLYVTDSIKIGDSSIFITGNSIYATNNGTGGGQGTLNINQGYPIYGPNGTITLINRLAGKVGIGTGFGLLPFGKLTIRDGVNNILSVAADYLNGNNGIILKCHKDNATNPSTLSLSAEEFNFYSDSHTNPDLKIKSNGRVGVGTSNPISKLTIKDGVDNNLSIGTDVLNSNDGILVSSHTDVGGSQKSLSFASNDFKFYVNGQTTPNMIIQQDGKVVIGDPPTTPTSGMVYQLYVSTGIITERLKVALRSSVDWQDKVFAPDYELLSLDSVELYTKSNCHLPGMPSADNLVKEGIDVANMDALLLKQIEELWLQLFLLKKENESLKDQINKKD